MELRVSPSTWRAVSRSRGRAGRQSRARALHQVTLQTPPLTVRYVTAHLVLGHHQVLRDGLLLLFVVGHVYRGGGSESRPKDPRIRSDQITQTRSDRSHTAAPRQATSPARMRYPAYSPPLQNTGPGKWSASNSSPTTVLISYCRNTGPVRRSAPRLTLFYSSHCSRQRNSFKPFIQHCFTAEIQTRSGDQL